MGPVCGNKVKEAGETCDGDCPSSCPGGSKCMREVLVGSPDDCTAECMPMTVTAPISGDGCCPDGATLANDADCLAKCGDGVVSGVETCDGNCPTSCSGGSKCMREKLVGAPNECTAACVPMTITARVNGDGCCPDGSTLADDHDCPPKCGDGVVSDGEKCDGNCPTSCKGGSGCTREKLIGSASACTAECVASTITARIDGDDCCPEGAGASDDKDCPAKCGDGAITGAEQCDPQASGWTTATCNASSCTRNVYQGCNVDNVNADCPPGQYCERGLCTPECGDSGGCPSIPTAPEPLCSQQHRCWLSCTVDADCPTGLGCVFFDTQSWRGVLIPAAHLCVQK